MTTYATETQHDIETKTWAEPEGIAPRGTLVLLGADGEGADVYDRFGLRISRDAYRVLVVPRAAENPSAARQIVADLIQHDQTSAPVIVAGTDHGGWLALQIAAENPGHIAGVVLAGIPAAEPGTDTDVAARSSCPNHRLVLARAALAPETWRPLPFEQFSTLAQNIAVPVLAFHGTADTVSPLEQALPKYQSLQNVHVWALTDGKHDIFNDVTHRSVASHVILFLEQLRADGQAGDIIRDITG